MVPADKITLRLRIWVKWFQWKHTAREKFQAGVAWRLPRWLLYWAAIRAVTEATTGKWDNQVPSELDVFTMLNRVDPKLNKE